MAHLPQRLSSRVKGPGFRSALALGLLALVIARNAAAHDASGMAAFLITAALIVHLVASFALGVGAWLWLRRKDPASGWAAAKVGVGVLFIGLLYVPLYSAADALVDLGDSEFIVGYCLFVAGLGATLTRWVDRRQRRWRL